MKSHLQKIIDMILPPRCLLCGKILSGENGLCEECFTKINFISEPICKKCGRPVLAADSVPSCPACINDIKSPFRMSRSRVHYDDASRPLLVNFKFHDKTENAPFLAKWLLTAGHDIWEMGVDVLIPVPMHKARLRQRKFNQSALLCKELNKLTGIPVDYNNLIRYKNTKPQVECSGKARKQNVRNAFKIKSSEKLKDKRIVLIDDVMTTGSTLRECALELIKNGALSVDALTVARVIKAG